MADQSGTPLLLSLLSYLLKCLELHFALFRLQRLLAKRRKDVICSLVFSRKQNVSALSECRQNLQFKGATRDHVNRLLTFIPHNDVNITLKYWKGSSNKESSRVQVAKAKIMPTNSVKYVCSKIINVNRRGLAEHPFVFVSSDKMQNELELRDVFSAITKHITLPVYNTGVEDVYLSKGKALGDINELEYVYVTSSEFVDPENDLVDCDTSNVKQEVRNFDHLSATIQERATKIMNKYEKRLKEPPKVTLVDHEINLQEIPVSLPPRRLPSSQRAEVQRQLKELLQKDVIEPSRPQFASLIVMVKKKDGSLRICVD